MIQTRGFSKIGPKRANGMNLDRSAVDQQTQFTVRNCCTDKMVQKIASNKPRSRVALVLIIVGCGETFLPA